MEVGCGIGARFAVDVDEGCAEEVLRGDFGDGGGEAGLDCWEAGQVGEGA